MTTKNCDGCAAGMPKRGNMHINPRTGRTHMICTADRYQGNPDFQAFCRNATDSQLETILGIEYRAGRANYEDAMIVAHERGWDVCNGVRI